jgi:bacterioferritin-associated ferredoxin
VIKAEIPFKAFILFEKNQVSFSGPVELEDKIKLQTDQLGPVPSLWQAVKALDGYDVLLNEFILKCQNNYKIPYDHEELCHCRMVQTDKVLNAIKQGLQTVPEISRVTMAGTGCGSCKKDIDDLIKYLLK